MRPSPALAPPSPRRPSPHGPVAHPAARAHVGARRLATLLGPGSDAVGGAAYVALADRVRLLVEDGRLAPQTRLPAERELAEELGRSRTTIVSAYARLRDSGHLVSLRGSGSVTVLPAASAERAGIDFAHAVPEPVPGLAGILQEVAADAAGVLALGGFDVLGDLALRRQVAERYTRRGLPTTPDEVMVTLGAQHGLALVARTLLRPGDRVLVESPTYPHGYEALREAGARLVPTPVGTDGWDADHLVDVLERVRPALAYLVPDFHNPTSASMPLADRRRVAAAARRSGTVLLLDETTVDLDLAGEPAGEPFAALCADRMTSTVTLGSLGKVVWGGLRIGWIRTDAATVRRLAHRRPAGDLGTPAFEQRVAGVVLERYDELAAVRAAQLRERHDVLVGLLRSELPDWGVPDVAGGLCLWVDLGAPVSSAVASAGQARGLHVTAGPKFCVDGTHERFLRVPFTAEPDVLAAGVAVLREVWHDLRHDVSHLRRTDVESHAGSRTGSHRLPATL
ncbi:PLP-dependent aminotransferase family protein [Nocardioides sp. CPCC 205120]|uniref:MocR-like transcription factor YczR n=1 Tax=Nocardioides sp. CPCC 205120 TaxID=3406462 RepID=UPI003B515093